VSFCDFYASSEVTEYIIQKALTSEAWIKPNTRRARYTIHHTP